MKTASAFRLPRLAIGLAGGLITLCAVAQSNYATPYAFTTLAGEAPGSADGTGTAARFNFSTLPGSGAGPPITPYFPVISSCCMAADSIGNIYVADSGNDTIRKITPSGVVTTLAGSTGQQGSSDGTGSAARFCQPLGVAVDVVGNVYVADTGNYTVRKVTQGGVVTTLAGTPGVPNADERGGAFDSPTGIAVDPLGNVYVADTGNNAVFKITPAGSVMVFAGNTGEFGLGGYSDGTGTAAQFKSPYGLAFDGSGNLFVADTGNVVIRKISPAGVVTTVAGTAGTPGNTPLFDGPSAVAVDGAGNVYVVDSSNCTIRKVTTSGLVTTLAGTAGVVGSANGVGTAAQFLSPIGVAVDNLGNVYVADNDAVRVISTSGAVSDFAGAPAYGHNDGTGAAAQFEGPMGLAVDASGTLYVADNQNNRIRMITPDGVVTTLAGSIDSPAGLALDRKGNIYVSTGDSTICKVTAAGVVTTLAGKKGSSGSADGTGSAALFDDPWGLAVDDSGNIYVADTYNYTIRKVTQSGVVTTLAGQAGKSGYLDGAGSAAQFNMPAGVAVDSSGNVYVAEWFNDTIREIAPGGDVTTMAGSGGKNGSADGVGSAARFFDPSDVAVDEAGNVYVADTFNETIREITPSGVVTTLAGGAAKGGSADGTGSMASFNQPWGVAVDSSGNLYVSDSGDNLIREGSLPSPPYIVTQPAGLNVNLGSAILLSASALGVSSYQWKLNGQPLSDSTAGSTADVISGATGPQLLVINITRASAGSYTLVATNSFGSMTSNAAVVQVAATSNPGYLTSMSARGFVGTGDGILIGGFYITGTTSVTVLVQAIGPALAVSPYNVSGTIRHPALTIHQTQNGHDVVLYSNTGWGTSQILQSAAAAVYAQPVLTPGSADSELLVTLPPGGYTAEVTGADGGTGVALIGVYQLP